MKEITRWDSCRTPGCGCHFRTVCLVTESFRMLIREIDYIYDNFICVICLMFVHVPPDWNQQFLQIDFLCYILIKRPDLKYHIRIWRERECGITQLIDRNENLTLTTMRHDEWQTKIATLTPSSNLNQNLTKVFSSVIHSHSTLWLTEIHFSFSNIEHLMNNFSRCARVKWQGKSCDGEREREIGMDDERKITSSYEEC